ncbi:MAG: SH3 domain-containing protein [Clostridia bacterium]|nr:SH3 domain-containing protein [Clostridia bacterium]
MRSTKGKINKAYAFILVHIFISCISLYLDIGNVYAYSYSEGIVICSSGKVRSDASAQSSVVFCVSKDEKITITDEKKAKDGTLWYQVELNGLKGYIRSDLVKKGAAVSTGTEQTKKTEEVKNEATAATDQQTQASQSGTSQNTDAVIKGTNVIIRTEAKRTSDVRCTLGTGHAVKVEAKVTGEDGKTWYEISFSKNEYFYKGFVREDFLSVNGTAGSSSKPTTQTVRTATGTIKGSHINVRKSVGTESEVVSTVENNFVVTIDGATPDQSGKNWYLVSYTSDGTTLKGYIREDFIDVQVQTSEVPLNPAKAVETGTIKGEGVRIRTTPSLTSNVSWTLPSGSSVQVIGYEDSEERKWCKVAFTANNEPMTGYICADFMEIKKDETKSPQEGNQAKDQSSLTNTVATVKGKNINLRKEPVSGEVILVLNEGQVAAVAEERKLEDGTVWYQIKFSLNGEEKEGYVKSDYLELQEIKTEKMSVAAVDKNRSGAIQGININVRKEPVTGEIVCNLSTGHTVTVTGDQTGSDGKKWYAVAFILNSEPKEGFINADYLTVEEMTASVNGADDGYMKGSIKGEAVRVRESAVNGTVMVQLSIDYPVAIIGETAGSDGYKWYQISFYYGGLTKTGYVRSDFVTITQTSSDGKVSEAEFEQTIASFPESYKASLRDLHAKYMNWKFEAVDTGLDWNDVVAAETAVGKNLIASNSIASWKSTDVRAYDYNTGTWYGFDGKSWVAASPEIIKFYLDPRNFLDDSGIFQFETLDAREYHNEAGVSGVLNSTFMSDTYLDTDGATRSYATTFVEAGAANGISPYHLAARCLQEQGTLGLSASISGTVNGAQNLFNYFNIGAFAANGNSAVMNGLIYAAGTDENYLRPWNSRYRSIMGSAKYVSERYVKKGQNTLYFQKFNVVNSENGIYTHQYMSNIQAASAEAARMKRAYSDLNAPLVFKIPVYKNMPDIKCQKPDSETEPNSYLSSLSVEGYTIAPKFYGDIEQYYLEVEPHVNEVTINATPATASASVWGTGTTSIHNGPNIITISCKAPNGEIRNYTLIVFRKES